MTDIARNLDIIRQKIAAIAQKINRNPAQIKLVAVSKTKSSKDIEAAHASGQTDFGENYAQEFLRKYEALSALPLRWHFIGSLQRRKIKDMIGKTVLIHSIDSLDSAREINKRAQSQNIVQEGLVQMNLGGEKTKSGISADNAAAFLKELSSLHSLKITGLMTLPPFFDNPEDVRPFFKKLRELKEAFSNAYGKPLTELSMGMTRDFPVAIEEGATIIRVGTGIFGER